VIILAKQKLIEKQPFKNKTAVVCGASVGIGKASAKEIVKLGGSVCIIARNLNTLKEAADDIKQLIKTNSQFVEYISCDAANIEELKPLLENFIKNRGTPDYLINIVGYAYPNYIQNYKFEDFKKNMEVNYYGQLVPTLIILPYFLKAKKGHFGFVSSVAGYHGVMGYATYTPTKFAIVGLAEVIRNELSPYNIHVSILYPPDTKTRGFEKENETKPKELHIMSERGGILEPEEVAEKFIEGILKKKTYITPGESKFIWKMKRLFPNLVNNITDKELKKARKKMGKLV